jgi:hypothetical protein
VASSCGVEIIAAVFDLFDLSDFAILYPVVPRDLPGRLDPVKGNGDPLETIGDLDRDRVERHPACLLKIRELGDLLSVKPDFPTQTPGAKGRGFPVILYEADIVQLWIDPQRLERLQVELLRIARIGLEDDLELVVQLETVGVFAVTPVVRTDGRFDIGDVPGFRAEDAQGGGGVHCPGPDLRIIRLPEQAAALDPVVLEGEDDLLEIQWHAV